MSAALSSLSRSLSQGVLALWQRRWANLCVVNLRFLIGFAFLPAGLKKVLAEPFTAAENVGAFHEFLRAFHATGFFYRFVGAVQLLAALLLLSQRFAALGAALVLPLLTAIVALCWSTGVYPTATVVTLMLLGTLALLAWELPRFSVSVGDALAAGQPRHDVGAWRACGLGIVLLYLAACALSGDVYRPRGAEWNRPAFYLLIAIAVSPLVTLALERRRPSLSGATAPQRRA
jgi:uncharacterized membrane protein YphA (DoxX/SURF4 family)